MSLYARPPKQVCKTRGGKWYTEKQASSVYAFLYLTPSSLGHTLVMCLLFIHIYTEKEL